MKLLRLFQLTVLAFFLRPPLSSGAEISTEAEACFQWFGTLGFPDVKQRTFAEVWSGNWIQASGKPPIVITAHGFVKAEDDQTFSMLGMNLLQSKLTKTRETTRPEGRVDWEPRALADYARESLDHWQHPPEDGNGRFGSKVGLKTQIIFLAHACWRKEEFKLAQALYDEAVRQNSEPRNRDDQPKTMRQALEFEMGHYAMWDAVLQCGGGRLGTDDWCSGKEVLARTVLVENFRRIIKNFPSCAHIERATESIAILERMIKQDLEHPVIDEEKLAQLPVEDQVREWIFRLRDQHGQQFDQPGWCSILGFNEEGTSPAHRVLRIGYAAVPQLIEAMSDDTFSRSVGFHRDFHFSHTILTIGDCAQQILNRLTGQRFYAPASTSGYMSRDDKTAATQKVAREWWANYQAKGERQSLIDDVSSGVMEPGAVAAKLKAKYPDDFNKALLSGATKAKNEWILLSFIRLMRGVKTDEATQFLEDKLTHGATGKVRLAAANQLFPRQRTKAVDQVMADFKNLKPSDDLFEPVVKFLSRCGEISAIQLLSQSFTMLSESCRLTIVEHLGEAFGPPEKHPWPDEIQAQEIDAKVKAAAVDLLASALDDTKPRIGMGGSRGEFRFNDPRICDMALWALNNISPEDFSFTPRATRALRDSERIAVANRWRTQHNQPLIPEIKGTRPVLDESEALRITMIRMPETLKELKASNEGDELKDMLAKLQDTPLESNTIPELLTWYAQHGVPGTNAISIEALREDDLKGLTVEISLNKGAETSPGDNWNTNHNVVIDNESLGNASGSIPRQHLGGSSRWKDLERNIKKAIIAPVRTPFTIRAGLCR